MMDLKLVLSEGEPDAGDKKVLVEGLLAHHAKNGHPRPPKRVFSLFLKGQDGRVFGGISASILWNSMELESLWMDQSLERHGWGSKLVQAAEAEAIKRGRTISYTNTFSWQAPQFYEKLEYTLYGKLDGFPTRNSLRYYCKKLSSTSGLEQLCTSGEL